MTSLSGDVEHRAAQGGDAGNRHVTIYDVAADAGVSPSTVSRAFARPGRVSPETSRRIHEAAARLGYRTVEIYRPPTSRTKSQMIGLLVSDVTNPFYFGIIRGAERATEPAGYSLVLIDAEESAATEKSALERVIPAVDGLLVASSRISDNDLRSVAKRVPVILLNRSMRSVPSVIPDTQSGVTEAVALLASLGHRRVCYVAGPAASWADGARWRAFSKAISGAGLVGHRLGPVKPTVMGGEEVAHELVATHCTAALAYNDLVAIGLMRGLGRLGFTVPHDLSVIGFDNTFATYLVTPGLTTIAAPLGLLGQRGTDAVLYLIGGGSFDQSGPMVVPVKLIVRGSTGPAQSR
ncbi:MAG TPA: LacI family DNA-binding transcriptional regulator [Propionibacteriaceae bacterium]|nr:LacI family DNA-binding transcriptional regulator [Propionibacteriaceae bacterium]